MYCPVHGDVTPIVGRYPGTIIKRERGRGRVQGKREGLWEYWEKVQVLWICRGVGVVTSRVIRYEYRM